MSESLVSVIILTYRNINSIYKTIDSILSQDYRSLELIIADDGSDYNSLEWDNVLDYINYRKKGNITKVILKIQEQNLGTVKNINLSINEASGYYVKVLASGDIFAIKTAVSTYVSYMREHNQLICFAKMQGLTLENQIVPFLSSCNEDYKQLSGLSPDKIKNKLFAKNFLPAPAWFAKAELFSRCGGFPEDIRLIEDYPYWIILASKQIQFGFLEEVLVYYELSGISSTGTYGKLFMEDMMKIYSTYIYPDDKRFGCFQEIYNNIKQLGLNTYMFLAEKDTLRLSTKLYRTFTYAPFLIYIWSNKYRYEHLNKRVEKVFYNGRDE